MAADRKAVFSTVNMVYMAVGAALIAVCSWISLNIGNVPFTLQTFAVCFVLGLLGGLRGTICVVVYILLGAVGVPVFSNFTGGFGKLLGMTGGYIIGFIFVGLVYWLLEKLLGKKLWVRIVSMVLGTLVCYAFGTAWFMVVYAGQSGPIGLGAALGMCVTPFLIPDAAKLVLAAIASDRVKKILHI